MRLRPLSPDLQPCHVHRSPQLQGATGERVQQPKEGLLEARGCPELSAVRRTCPPDLVCGQGVGALLRTRWSSPDFPAVCPEAVCLPRQHLVGTEQDRLISCQDSLRSHLAEAQRGSVTWPRSHSIPFALSYLQAQNHFQPTACLHSPPTPMFSGPVSAAAPLHKFSSWTSAAGLELGEETEL